MPAVFVILLAAICFGTTGTAQALAGVDASPLAVGAARVLIGGGLLGVIALALRAKTQHQHDSSFRGFPKPFESAINQTASKRNLLTVLIGAIGVLAYQPAFFAGTSLSGVALGTVVALGSAPVFTGVLDSILYRRLPSLRWVLITLLAVFGVLLVSGVLSVGAASEVNVLGLAGSLAAGASYAVYTIASKRLLDQGWGSTETMGALFGTAALLSIPVLLLAGAGWLATANGLALSLWLGVVTVTAAYLLFGWGLRRLNANTVATLTLAEPLTATLLGVAVLGERLSTVSIVGLAVLGGALVLLSLPERGRESAVATSAVTSPATSGQASH